MSQKITVITCLTNGTAFTRDTKLNPKMPQFVEGNHQNDGRYIAPFGTQFPLKPVADLDTMDDLRNFEHPIEATPDLHYCIIVSEANALAYSPKPYTPEQVKGWRKAAKRVGGQQALTTTINQSKHWDKMATGSMVVMISAGVAAMILAMVVLLSWLRGSEGPTIPNQFQPAPVEAPVDDTLTDPQSVQIQEIEQIEPFATAEPAETEE